MSDDFDYENQIKVEYLTLDGARSKAYISSVTKRGVNKHTDEPVTLEWTGAEWRQIDDE